MAKSEEQIKSDIKNFVNENGGAYSDWYVGISEDPESRLQQHGSKNAWIYREATSNEVARRIEKYFVEVLGTDGGSGGGDEYSDYVYAYKKNSHTEP